MGGSEEFAKLVPVLAGLLIASSASARLHAWFDLDPRGYLFLGCLSGVVFGCAEGVEYIVGMQSADVNGQSSVFDMTSTVFLRLITDPIDHALWAGITGYFLGLAVVRARAAGRRTIGGVVQQSWLIGLGLLLSATLHGINDFAAAHALVQAVVAVLSAALLLGYATAGDVVEQAIASAPAPQWGARLARRLGQQQPVATVPAQWLPPQPAEQQPSSRRSPQPPVQPSQPPVPQWQPPLPQWSAPVR